MSGLSCWPQSPARAGFDPAGAPSRCGARRARRRRVRAPGPGAGPGHGDGRAAGERRRAKLLGARHRRREALILRRVQVADGRARAFVNDRRSACRRCRRWGAALVESHGQPDAGALVDAGDAPASARRLAAGWRTTRPRSGAWRRGATPKRRSRGIAPTSSAPRARPTGCATRSGSCGKLKPEGGEETALADRRPRMMRARKMRAICATRMTRMRREARRCRRWRPRCAGWSGAARRRWPGRTGGESGRCRARRAG